MRSFENPLNLHSYDGTEDSDVHVEHVDDFLDYYHNHEAIKCKLYALTLIGSVMAWLKSFSHGSINSWPNICEAFTTQKKQPTTMVMTNEITLGKK